MGFQNIFRFGGNLSQMCREVAVQTKEAPPVNGNGVKFHASITKKAPNWNMQGRISVQIKRQDLRVGGS